jgi:O-antigen ligase/polysaccharide polymerase Wzy-like membrane protein
LGLGLVQHIPLVAYLGFWVMCLVSLAWRPLWGLYFLIPFLPYRSMRDHFLDYPLGAHVLLILVVAVIVGAVLHGKRLPKSKLYILWLVIGVYLYLSMWLGAALGNAPAPLWLSDANFVVWKDYLVIPLVFVATSLVVEDRKAVRMVIIITAITLLLIDRSCILESRLHSWTNFDESKRDVGPLIGVNTTAAFLAQFAMFFWGFLQFIRAKRFKLLAYGLVAATLYATMYLFSRGAYLAVLVSVLVLGILKDRKLLVILGVFLLTWQLIVPKAVHERVSSTENSSGQLESSAQTRVDLWKESWNSIVQHPILGNGFATYQYGQHVGNLTDTHDWFIKVMVETGTVGLIMYLFLLQQMLALGYRLFRRGKDPMYRGLGLGLLLTLCSSMAANCFGDRWTYLEVTGLLFVLVAAAVRANQLTAQEPLPEPSPLNSNALAVTNFA